MEQSYKMLKSIRELNLKSRGISGVLTAMILCASVLVIGGAVWAFSNNSSSVMGSNYFEEVDERVEKLRERFIIENIDFYEDTNTLCVWIYNCGEIDINATIYVYHNGNNIGQLNYQSISSGAIKQNDIILPSFNPNIDLIVKVKSVRENIVYESYLVR